jgi:hypothetical protein
VIENCAIATMDAPRSSVADGGELRTVDAATAAREVRAARLRLVGPVPG